MKVTVEYGAQVKRAAGLAAETVEVGPGCTLQQLASQIAAQHGDALRELLFDADHQLHASILVFVGDNQVRCDQLLKLNDADVVTFLSPISGG